MKELGELEQSAARLIGEVYDGYADPVATPNNWARAVRAIKALAEAGLVIVPRGDDGPVPLGRSGRG